MLLRGEGNSAAIVQEKRGAGRVAAFPFASLPGFLNSGAFSPLLSAALSLPLLQSPGFPLTRAGWGGCRAGTAPALGARGCLSERTHGSHPGQSTRTYGGAAVPEVSWAQPPGTAPRARDAAPAARAQRASSSPGKGCLCPEHRPRCPPVSGGAISIPAAQHTALSMGTTEGTAQDFPVLPRLSCKGAPSSRGKTSAEPPRCRCHTASQSATLASSHQDRLPWKPVCLSDAHGTNPSPAVPSNQEASGRFRGDVLASPSRGRAEGHTGSENLGCFLTDCETQ